MALRRIFRILLRTTGLLLLLAVVVFILGWNLGWIFSDRWIWSQWLSWMPALSLTPIGLLFMTSAWMVFGRNVGWQAGLSLVLAGPTIFLVQNWRPGQFPTDDHDGITITHWTLGSVLSNEESYADILIDTGSQLNIIEGGRKVKWTKPIKDWLGPGNTAPSTGIFSVITKLPMGRLRHLIWADGIHVAKLEVHGPGFGEQPLRILLIDLPSDPVRSRWDIASQCRSLLEQTDCGGFDLVIGDFNMPADSVALASLFPGYRQSWGISGQGWGPTYPRVWPVARLDHVLQGPGVEVTMLRTMDPGLGRHCLQTMTIKPRLGISSDD